jgi:hypothetical protein
MKWWEKWIFRWSSRFFYGALFAAGGRWSYHLWIRGHEFGALFIAFLILIELFGLVEGEIPPKSKPDDEK